jgi:nucleoside-diphosphate-sugar epimerase
MSGGEQLRDYLHISEVARKIACLAMIRRNVGTINICSGKPISVRRLVEQWINENEWKIGLKLGHYPYPDYEPMAFWGDASKIAILCDGK